LRPWAALITQRDLRDPDQRIRAFVGSGPRLYARKNQRELTPTEWSNFISAIEAIAEDGAESPTYDEFVQVHIDAMETDAGMTWGAHTMPDMNMVGKNFLPWHREYLAKLEARLRLANPLVTLPYWDWSTDPTPPDPLSNAADLRSWGVTRRFNREQMPSRQELEQALGSGVEPPSLATFQSALELPHNSVHVAIAGTFRTSSSPADPLFWLHHAFIDKLWADWERAHAGERFEPANLGERLHRDPITRHVRDVLSTEQLGYTYA